MKSIHQKFIAGTCSRNDGYISARFQTFEIAHFSDNLKFMTFFWSLLQDQTC